MTLYERRTPEDVRVSSAGWAAQPIVLCTEGGWSGEGNHWNGRGGEETYYYAYTLGKLSQ